MPIKSILAKLQQDQRLFFAGVFFSFGMILGRFLGLFREITLSYYFGVSAQADIAVLLLTFPEMIIALLSRKGNSISSYSTISKNARRRKVFFLCFYISLSFFNISFGISFLVVQSAVI